MTIALVINGVTFPYPEQGDEDWGPTATDWAAAVTSGMLQKAGGAFTLTADVDFGASFGLKSTYYKTRTANLADAGQFRLARADVVSWRNQANSANLDLGVNSSNQLTFDGVPIESNTLTSAHIFVGNVSNVATDVAVSGDLTLANTGAFTVVTVGGSSAANIHTSQLLTAAATAANTVSTLVLRDGSGNFAAGTITASLTGVASGNTTYTPNQYGVVISGSANVMSVLAPDASTSKLLKSGGASANPSWLSYTDANTVSTIVARDGSGNFSAGTITAALTGTASGNPPNARLISTTAPLTGGGDLSADRTIAMPVSTNSVDGYLSAADHTTFSAKQSATLTSAHIFVGNVSNVATDVAVSGDLTLANTGAFTIANSAITNAKVSASAAIDFSKLAVLASGNILVGSAGGVVTSVVMSGDATIIANGALTIANNAVTNAKLAQVANATFKGRTTAGTGNVEDLNMTQATAMLNNLVGDSGSGGTKGLVPAPAAGDAAASKFLKADGNWSVPSGAGDVTGPGSSTANAVVLFNSTSGKVIKDGGIGTSSQVLVGGTTPAFGNTPAASLPLATSSVRGAIVITSPTTQKFTSGSGTYTTPAGVSYIRLIMVGGGGGAAGGGAGASSGSTGVASTFGGSTAAAGGGGSSASGGTAGTGGTATLGSGHVGINVTGGGGGGTAYDGSGLANVYFSGGTGGNSALGGGGYSQSGGNGQGGIANTGGGGAGGGTQPTSVGAGTGGGAGGYIDALIVAPAATYSYAVGTGGNGTAGGTNGFTGGDGGSGLILVQEFYY